MSDRPWSGRDKTVSDGRDWNVLRDRRLAEPGAVEAYEATRIAFESGEELQHRGETVAGVSGRDRQDAALAS